LSRISIRRAHSLPAAEARRLADDLVARLSKEYGVRAKWDGETLRFERTSLSGTLHLAPGEVRLEMTLGLLLLAFRDPIAKALERHLDQHLSPKPAPKPRGRK
jgi:putative polyhydroxyalkanoate system protein